MRKTHLIPLMLFVIFAFSSCKKTTVDCFSDPGEIKNETRTLDSMFSYIEMYDNIDVELVASSKNFVEVIAGKNLISAISTEIISETVTQDPIPPDTNQITFVQNKLIIRNNSSCSFLRNDDRQAKVIVYYTELEGVTYRSNGNLTALGNIKSSVFKIDIFEGSGKIHLKLDSQKSFLNYHFGTAELEVVGQSDVNYIYQVSYGPINAQLLETGITYLETRSANSCNVKVIGLLEATINGPGNVYYFGNPANVLLKGSGSGKLIKGD